MGSSLQSLTKELDIVFFVFFERYATDLLKWNILTQFARNPNLCDSAASIAQRIGLNLQTIWPELGDLVLLGILERTYTPDRQTLYQLSRDKMVRRVILKFADQVAAHTLD